MLSASQLSVTLCVIESLRPVTPSFSSEISISPAASLTGGASCCGGECAGLSALPESCGPTPIPLESAGIVDSFRGETRCGGWDGSR